MPRRLGASAVDALVFAHGLFDGWLRVRSGSILGTWLIHTTANVAMCLNGAIQPAT